MPLRVRRGRRCLTPQDICDARRENLLQLVLTPSKVFVPHPLVLVEGAPQLQLLIGKPLRLLDDVRATRFDRREPYIDELLLGSGGVEHAADHGQMGALIEHVADEFCLNRPLVRKLLLHFAELHV